MRRAIVAVVVAAGCGWGMDLGEVRALMVNRVDESRKAAGLVVGVMDASGRQVVARGTQGGEGSRELDGDTVFEIGSVTKVFTSLVLADMVERGEVKLDDPVAKYLPEGVRVPERNGRKITLLDLSMQISGLPRMPDNLLLGDGSNPYAAYRPPQMYDFLSRYTLPREIGEQYEYSNLAVGLLGHALARRVGTSYEALVRRRILEPLGMRDTSVVLSEGQKARLAQGHNAALMPVANWDFDVLAGAGALRSTANDMLKLVAANLGLTSTPLVAAMKRMRSVRHETSTAGLGIMMGWHVLENFGTDVIWHNGETGGYRSFVGFNTAATKGVVVLCNTAVTVDDLGLHVLEPRYPAARLAAVEVPKAVTVTAAELARYEGVYEMAPGVTFRIRRDGARMVAEASGQPPMELFATGEDELAVKGAEIKVRFAVDSAGAVSGLVLQVNGNNVRAAKLK